MTVLLPLSSASGEVGSVSILVLFLIVEAKLPSVTTEADVSCGLVTVAFMMLRCAPLHSWMLGTGSPSVALRTGVYARE